MALTKEQQQQESQYIIPYHHMINKDSLINLPDKLVIYPEYLSKVNIIKDLLKPYNSQKVLDAGCGDGKICYELEQENLKVFGIDYSKQAISLAKQFCKKAKLFVSDIKKTRFKPNSFDCVLCIDVIEHILPEQVSDVVKEMYRIMKYSGKLIITVPHKNRKLNPKHFQHFDLNSLTLAVSPYFKVVSSLGEHNNSWFRNLMFKLQIFKCAMSWIIPFLKRYQIGIIEKGNLYYEQKLRTATTDNCYNLIVVFEKV